MEIVVTARHTEVSGRFRRHLEDKLSKVAQLAPRALRLEVGVSHEVNKRQAHLCERIELTLLGPGPVVRAEACADDPYVALDLATTKLQERLRRASDRRKVHHGRHPLASVRVDAPVVADLVPLPAAADTPSSDAPEVDPVVGAAASPPAPAGRAAARAGEQPDFSTEYGMGESPVLIRDKVHVSVPMTLDDALVEMELVGHDFFLFTDASTGAPSVVYRRRGWSYGVIRLAGDEQDAARIGVAVAEQASRERAPEGEPALTRG